MREMHWRVFVEDFNGRRIEDFDAFAKKVRSSLFYYYHSKCEWEIVVSSWLSSGRVPDRKVDVYEQVMLNWDVFIEYVWHQAHARKVGK